jgi:uncharacterized membrane protein
MQKDKLIAILVIAALLPKADASISFGGGPSVLDLGNMERGELQTTSITVSTSGKEDLDCEISFQGEAADWLTTELKTFNLPAHSRKKIFIKVDVPYDAPNGMYTAEAYVKASKSKEESTGAALNVGAGVIIKIMVEVVGEEKIS